MNANDVPTMMLCPNFLRRVAKDNWNDEEAAGIAEENEVGIAAAGSAGILAAAITRHGAWRSDRTFNTYLSNQQSNMVAMIQHLIEFDMQKIYRCMFTMIEVFEFIHAKIYIRGIWIESAISIVVIIIIICRM